MQLATLTERRPYERLELLRIRDTTEVLYHLVTFKLGNILPGLGNYKKRVDLMFLI